MSNGNEDFIDIEVEDTVNPEVGQENVLHEGTYILEVPEGQRAIVKYELSVDED
jgi:pimeloyl-CoA synthetase